MPRNISFAMTTPQFINQTKDVTRRWAWKWLAEKYNELEEQTFTDDSGKNPISLIDTEILMGVEKAMGLKKGEKMKRLGLIEVVSVRIEPLDLMIRDLEYGDEEMRREGFPFGMTDPEEFVHKLAKEGNKSIHDEITRIEFRYLQVAK